MVQIRTRTNRLGSRAQPQFAMTANVAFLCVVCVSYGLLFNTFSLFCSKSYCNGCNDWLALNFVVSNRPTSNLQESRSKKVKATVGELSRLLPILRRCGPELMGWWWKDLEDAAAVNSGGLSEVSMWEEEGVSDSARWSCVDPTHYRCRPLKTLPVHHTHLQRWLLPGRSLTNTFYTKLQIDGLFWL